MSESKPSLKPPTVAVVYDEESVLHAKIDAAITAAAVSKDLFEKVDNKLSGVFGKIRKLERLVLVVAALVITNFTMLIAILLLLVESH